MNRIDSKPGLPEDPEKRGFKGTKVPFRKDPNTFARLNARLEKMRIKMRSRNGKQDN